MPDISQKQAELDKSEAQRLEKDEAISQDRLRAAMGGNNGDTCPDCGTAALMQTGVCKTCTACGWTGSCG